MTYLSYPICAVVISTIINIIFFSKKRFSFKETNCYKLLILTTLLENIIVLLVLLFIKSINNGLMLNFLFKIDYVLILLWAYWLLSYFLIINEDNVKKISIMGIVNLATSLVILFCPINVIINNDVVDSNGFSLNVLLTTCGIYMMLIVMSIGHKVIKDGGSFFNKKYYPFYSLIILVMLLMAIKIYIPQIIIQGFAFAIIILIMYFTIENPDLQMLKEFHKAKEQAEESNREKTSFLFNISNEIKKPINNIIYTSENAINKQEISDIKNDLRAIKGDSNNLLSYVNNVLDISDEEIRQIEIKGSKYNSKRLFEIISKKYEPTLNKIEYRFKYDNSTPEYLYGDSMRIKQIVNILLENAREYTKQGYIELSVNSIVKNEICRLVITVEDSGTGMDTETIKHLFDKDKIYDDKLLREIDDTKNNLSILKSIVNLMNGSVLVESTIGSGSKFTVILDQKISTEKTKIEEKVEEYEKMYEKDKKIILVTDNKEISTKIQKILKKLPYKLEIVTLGQTCLEQIRSGTEYDLIIIDEEIPKLNYEDTLNKIKETKCYKKPVLLITSNQIFGSKEMYQEKGFKDTIYKPIKKEELIHEIEEYINE